MDSSGTIPVFGGNGITGYHSSANVNKPTIVIGRVGFYCGSVHDTKGEAWVTDNAFAVTFNEKNINREWLYYLLLALNLGQFSKSTAQPVISGLTIYPVQILLPPLSEQKRIVEELGKWLSIIASIELSQKELQSYIENTKTKILDLAIHGKLVPHDPNDEPAIELLRRINPNFTPCDNGQYGNIPQNWCVCRLKDLCTFLSRGKSPKYSETDKTYPVFAQKCNLKEGGISLEQARFLDPSTIYKWSEVYKLRTGDILVNSTGTGTVGRTRLFSENCLGQYSFVVPDSHVSVIRTLKEIESRYIYACISSQLVQQYLEDNLAGSTNQKELYIGILEDLRILLPPKNEQLRIAQKVEGLFATLDNIQNSLEA